MYGKLFTFCKAVYKRENQVLGISKLRNKTLFYRSLVINGLIIFGRFRFQQVFEPLCALLL